MGRKARGGEGEPGIEDFREEAVEASRKVGKAHADYAKAAEDGSPVVAGKAKAAYGAAKLY